MWIRKQPAKALPPNVSYNDLGHVLLPLRLTVTAGEFNDFPATVFSVCTNVRECEALLK